jgi:putative transposase
MMEETLKRAAADRGYYLDELKVLPDRIDCVVIAPPTISPANIARVLKGVSARVFLHNNPLFRKRMYGSEHLWNPSYYIASVRDMSETAAIEYVERQKQDA